MDILIPNVTTVHTVYMYSGLESHLKQSNMHYFKRKPPMQQCGHYMEVKILKVLPLNRFKIYIHLEK